MGTAPDFDPGRPLFSDRGVYAICGTAIGLAVLALLAFVAWRDIKAFQEILAGAAVVGFSVIILIGLINS